MRLNKFISETGMCSRREADALIEQGRVTVNGVRAQLGTQVEESDDVRVNRQRIGARRKKHVYIALNKPVGITCSTERHIAGNIIDFVGHPERIFPVGRLDKDSEGLILLTSDGDIVNEILRKENNHEKEYVVTVDRPITETFLASMAGGVRLPELNVTTKRCKVTLADTRPGSRSFRIILTQGLNRQIRRMCEVFGYTVERLQRVRIMNIRLRALEEGQWRDLSTEELSEILARGPAAPVPPARPFRRSRS